MNKILLLVFGIFSLFFGSAFAVTIDLTGQGDKAGLIKPVFQGPGIRKGAEFAGSHLDTTISKERDLKKLLAGWTRFLLPLIAVGAVVGFVWAGILYITGFSDEGNIEKAKKIVIYIVLGLILILGAYAIVNTIIRGTVDRETVQDTRNLV